MKREYAGQSLEYKSSSSSLYFMFLLAIVFIYLVLAAQFESFIHPLTILLSVPLAVFGASVDVVHVRTESEHLLADRADHADRPGHEERDSDCGVLKPVAEARGNLLWMR